MAWKLADNVVKNLGQGWQIASALQNSGEYRGLATGPDEMQLFFIARTEKIDPCMEHICPPLGWLRVDGRLPFSDQQLYAKLSLELRESLTAEEISNEIKLRLLPVYRELLRVITKHQGGVPVEIRGRHRMLKKILRWLGKGLLAIIMAIFLIGLWAYIGGMAIGLITRLFGPERFPLLIANSPTILLWILLGVLCVVFQIKRTKSKP